MDILAVEVFMTLIIRTSGITPTSPHLTYVATCPISPLPKDRRAYVTCKLDILSAGSSKPVRQEQFIYDQRVDNLGELVTAYTRTLD